MRLPATDVDHPSVLRSHIGGKPDVQQARSYSNGGSSRNGKLDGQVAWWRKLKPAEGWMVLAFLTIALYSVVASIRVVNWVGNSALLFWMPVCGLAVGLVVAKIPRFPQSILHLAACLIGHWLTVWLTSALAFHISWIAVLADLREAFSGQVWSVGGSSEQHVLFFYLSFLCFFLGYFGCWLIYRAHLPWLVALVYCSIMLVNLNYVRKQVDFLMIILLGSLLLLIARMSLIAQIAQWKREGLRTDHSWLHSIIERCMLVACVITVLALLFSSLLPVLAQPENAQAFGSDLQVVWSDLTTGRFSMQDLNDVISSLQPSGNSFGDQLMIVDSTHLPTGQVLSYRDSNGGGSISQPHYLEGLTYNLFDGHSWHSSVSRSRTYAAGEPLPIDLHGSNVTGPVMVAITQLPQETNYYIFGPEQPFSFSVPIRIYEDGIIGAWAQQTPLYSGEKYSVSFSAPPTDSRQLSQMPLPASDQSAWNADQYYTQQKANYLQVPGDLSPNVIQTAKQWAQGATTAYTALKMLEAHFDDTNVFTYSLQNPPIPANKDVVDWLLETHQGYCTYYASAMAIMGRLLGIPTRIVSGFSQGHFDQEHNEWVVDGNDAHSWVQAYLPNVGWISFDPTPTFNPNAAPSPSIQPTPSPPIPTVMPSSTAIQHPTANPMPTVSPQSSSSASVQVRAGNHNQSQGVLMGIMIAGLVLVLLSCLALIGRYWWRRFSTRSVVVEVLFWRFCQVARWVGLGPKPSQTPYEYSAMLGRQLPAQATVFSRLTKLFVRERWGIPHPTPRKLEPTDAAHIWDAIRSLLLSRFLQLLRSGHWKGKTS
jgi:transglutaminase-like putative cysteine protease